MEPRTLLLKRFKTYKENILNNPDDARSWHELRLIYEETKNLDEAEKLCKDILSRNKDNVFALIHLGILSRMNNDFNRALEYFKKAIVLDDKNDYAWSEIIFTFEGYTDTDKIKDFCRNLDFNNEYVSLLLGISEKIRGNYEEAIKHLKEAKTKNQTNNKITNELGFVCINMGEYKKAMELS